MVGLIEMIVRSDHLFIENVAVSPEHQGQGLGRRLLAHAERVALARGYRDIRLLANAVFESNISLYKAVGYRIDREEPFHGRDCRVYEQESRVPRLPFPLTAKAISSARYW
jgi:ribosomal protein S18 acetylase RimI-like enzyme